ncbi:hypothetical protein LSH36_160g01042 [Paralvinella palmiformis]|uniref:Transmembrane protein n=1 Tax=Paralvinella palmiformis TaxID=53620 RepID=A0AAD9JU86_9ANNE|nr:hypothetical protein LSH36_160g01042 [Paralvinella palmiformis]
MEEEETVLSVRRPLRVQRSKEITEEKQEADSSSDNPGVPSLRRREFYSEEIEQHAHVTMETRTTFYDVLANTNWPTFFYFAFLVTASMFISLGMEIPTVWMISLVASLSVGLFAYLKL